MVSLFISQLFGHKFVSLTFLRAHDHKRSLGSKGVREPSNNWEGSGWWCKQPDGLKHFVWAEVSSSTASGVKYLHTNAHTKFPVLADPS